MSDHGKHKKPLSAFEKALVLLDVSEGGYNDRAADAGGPTNFGISQRAYPNINIKKLTREHASSLFRRDYWDKIQGDKLPASLATSVFDFAVNSGVSKASKELQRALNATALRKKDKLTVDGKIGPMTLAKIAALDLEDPKHSGATARRINGVRRAFLKRLAVKRPSDQANINGWMNRLDRLDKIASSQ